MFIGQIIKQKPYERIEYLLRRHALTFIPKILTFLVLMAMPIGLYFLITNLYPTIFETEKYFTLAVLFASIYYLSIYLFAYGTFIDFYLDIWVVTNDRIVNMEQKGLLATKVTELDLYRIQDVTVDVRGLFQTLINYGDLIVKTASSNTHIIFRRIPNPNELRQTLIALAEEDRKFHHNQ